MRKLFYAWNVAIGRLALTWWSARAYVSLRIRGAHIGRRLRVTGPLDLHIHPTARVVIGDHCRIHSGFRGNAVGGFRRTGIWASRNAEIIIGNEVGLSNCTLVARQRITIEDQVFVGGDCNLYDNDFHSIAPEQRLQTPDPGVAAAALTLKRRSFIGGHVLILKGVTVGEGAVVGAGSVVTRDVPANEIWAGNPARFIGNVRPNAAQTAGGR